MFGTLIPYNKIGEIKKYISENIGSISEYFVDYVSKKGAQGIIGIINVNINESKELCVFKISKHLDFTISNEDIVMSETNKLREICPHFCVSFGKYNCNVSSYYYDMKTNPFIDNDIQMETLIIEHIEGIHMTKIVDKISLDDLFSCIKQIILAIDIAQRYISLTHYDLHSDNIIMVECPKNALFVYSIDEYTKICVQSIGLVPVIIDYGFSYVKGSKYKPLYSTLEHTDAGYLGCVFDRIHDCKILLIGLANDMEGSNCNGYKKVRKIVDSLFGKLTGIDWTNGWDDNKDCSALEYVSYSLIDSISSKIIERHINTILVMIHSLIILPITDNGSSDIIHPYRLLEYELIKIEHVIKDEFHFLFIIRTIIDIIRPLRIEFEKDPRKISLFLKNKLASSIDTLIPFFEFPEDICYENIISSLFNISNNMETIFSKVLHDIKIKKNKIYNKLPYQLPLDIYTKIEREHRSEFKIDSETEIYIWDLVKNKNSKHKLPENKISEIHLVKDSKELGNLLYNLFE